MADMQARSVVQWLMEGVRAHQAQDLARAKTCYRAALQLVPDQADALHLLGVIADQEGEHAEAVSLIRRAIAISPQAANFHGNLGTALLSLGDEAGAEVAYRDAVALDPAYVDGHVNLGNLQWRKGNIEEAVLHYEAALRLEPRHGAAKRSLIQVLIQQRRMEEALKLLDDALQVEPTAADLHDMTGLVLRSLDRFKEAVQHCRQAVKLDPSDVGFRERYAASLAKLGTPKARIAAAKQYEAVLAEEPERMSALVGYANLLLRQQKPVEVLEFIQRAASLDENRLDVLTCRSIALMLLGRVEEAMRDCERAISQAPDDYALLLHRGTLREQSGDYEGALSDYRAALATDKSSVEGIESNADFKLSILLLSLGRLREGWPLYRARTEIKSADTRSKVFISKLPDWDGVVRSGQRILVWGEQGIGDQVIYAQMLPELAARGAEFCCACDARLVPLFCRSFPNLRIEPLVKGQYEFLASLADVQVGLGDLGMFLRPTLADFPPPRPYLRPDPDLVAHFRRQYCAYGRRHVIGLSWRSKNIIAGEYKSIALHQWAPVLEQDDILFVDIQYGDTTQDRNEVKSRLGIEILHDETVDALVDIDRYAAQVAAMDLVIATSNTGLHIAGALGKEAWGLVPTGLSRLWYWFLERHDSPWYANMRLFRQSQGRVDDWTKQIADVADELQIWRRKREMS